MGCGLLLWAALFVADETYERVIGIGVAFLGAITQTVKWRRARWEDSLRRSEHGPS